MVKKLLKEPLLHFLLIGIALFAINYSIHPSIAKEQAAEEVVVDSAIVEKIKLQYKQFTGMDATQAEVDSFINNYINEEIQYREALKAGLDKTDETRTLLIRQMNTASKEMMAVAEPTTQQLESFYANNPTLFSYLDSNNVPYPPNFKDVVPIVRQKFIDAEKERQLKQKQRALQAQYRIINKYRHP